MIDIKKTERWCGSCNRSDTNNAIAITLDGTTQSSTISLCDDCLRMLICKLHPDFVLDAIDDSGPIIDYLCAAGYRVDER